MDWGTFLSILLGAVLSLLGGLALGLFQERRTRRMVRDLDTLRRQDEREETALLRLEEAVTEFERWLELNYRGWEKAVQAGRGAEDVDWPKATAQIASRRDNLAQLWEEASTRLRRSAIQGAYGEVRSQADVAYQSGATKSNPLFTYPEFLKTSGRLLMNLADLRKEIQALLRPRSDEG